MADFSPVKVQITENKASKGQTRKSGSTGKKKIQRGAGRDIQGPEHSPKTQTGISGRKQSAGILEEQWIWAGIFTE